MAEPATWQVDPTGRHEHRFWDGAEWTEHVADAGVRSTDPYRAPDAPSASGWAAPIEPARPVPPPTRPARPAAPVSPATPAGPAPAPSSPSGWGMRTEPTVRSEPARLEPARPAAAPAAAPDADPAAPADPPPPKREWAPTTPPPVVRRPRTHRPPTPIPAPAPVRTRTSRAPRPARRAPQMPAALRGLSSEGRRLLAGSVLGIVVLLVIVFAVTRGGSGHDVTDDVAAYLERSQPTLDSKAVDCRADKVVAALGADRLEGVDLGTTPSGDLADELGVALSNADRACAAETTMTTDGGGASGSGGSTDSGTDSGGTLTTETTVDPAVAALPLARQQRIALLESNLGVTHTQAVCLDAGVAEAEANGSIDGSSSIHDMRTFFERCGVPLETPLTGTP